MLIALDELRSVAVGAAGALLNKERDRVITGRSASVRSSGARHTRPLGPIVASCLFWLLLHASRPASHASRTSRVLLESSEHDGLTIELRSEFLD